MGELLSSLANQGSRKLYEGELWSESFRTWLYHIYLGLKRKIWDSSDAGVNQFRLISENWFFEDDYLDVSIDFVPVVGQKIKVQEVGGIFMVIRKSDQDKEYELLKKEEGLVHSSELISREYLKERYPYLMYPSDKSYNSCQLLEVIDVISMGN